MQITVINSITAYDTLKENWSHVYQDDDQATIFLSWAWLRGYLVEYRQDWFILAAHPADSDDFVAFLPLAVTHQFGGTIRTLEMAGSPEADYTGFVCLPDYTEEAMAAFAMHVRKQVVWDRFSLKDVQDNRLNIFLKNFSTNQFEIRNQEASVCPYIPLPDDWETYLRTMLSKRARQGIRQAFRKVKRLAEYHYTIADTSTFDTHMQVLQDLWSARWGSLPFAIDRIFDHCQEQGSLWLGVLWDGETPMAVLAGLIDWHKGRFYCLMGAFNDDYRKLAPGKALDALSIEYAINHKLKIYDYLRGAESYKFRMGSVEGNNFSVLIWKRSLKHRLFYAAKFVREHITI